MLDCVDGYHGIPTFVTEWGMFWYTHAPQGYLSSGDSYSKYTDAKLENYPSTSDEKDFEKIVDDVITWSTSVKGAFNRICSILSHCNKYSTPHNSDPRDVRWNSPKFLITD